MISITKSQEGAYQVAGEILNDQVDYTLSALKTLVSDYKGRSLELDMSQISTVSSVVLGVLLSVLREARRQNCQLKFSNLSDDLFSMARVGGVETLLSAI